MLKGWWQGWLWLVHLFSPKGNLRRHLKGCGPCPVGRERGFPCVGRRSGKEFRVFFIDIGSEGHRKPFFAVCGMYRGRITPTFAGWCGAAGVGSQ